MSTTIDQKVVEMKFDNKHFETNIRTTMASLDKLKEKISFKGAKQGIQEVANSVERISFGALDKGLDSTAQKFDALKVIAIGALMNIGAQIEQTAMKLINDFTLAPVKSGFEEYELKMGSVQTIMASTGADIATVNKYLDELNLYADKTIYSFADMTQNIGKFTNAGVDLDKAVLAIQGVSNEAAVSGANANEASRAMYNFAQALSAGYVKLIDWKSIENANMATVEFKNELIKTAEAIGTVKKNADGMYTVLTTDAKGSKMDQAISATRNFNDSLQFQWMTTDVLVDTLARYADETTEIGKKAFAAAQDVKTFSQLMDTMREAAQSGWTETWQLIIGDFEEAKVLWTEVSQFFGGVIDSMSAARNDLLAPALKSNWSKLSDELNAAGVNADELKTKIREIYEGSTGHDWDELMKKYGNIGNAFEKGAIKVDYLKWALQSFNKEAPDLSKITGDLGIKAKGDDVKQLQTALKNLGFEFSEYGIDGIIGKETESAIKAFQEANKLKITGIADSETIAKIKELSGETQNLNEKYKDLIESVNKKGGRTLLIDGLRNSLKAILGLLEPIKKAWRDLFPAKTSDQVFNAIQKFNEFTKTLKVSKSTAENIRETFKGLFSILDLFGKVVSSIASFAFPKLFSVAKTGSGGILSFTAAIGRALTGFHDWVVQNNKIIEVIQTFMGWIDKAKSEVQDFFGKIANTEGGQKIKKALDDISTSVQNTWDKITAMSPDELFRSMAEGFQEFLNELKNIPLVNKAITGISDIWQQAKDGVKEFGMEALDRLGDFFQYVASMDGVSIQNIGDAIKYFFDNVLRIGEAISGAGTKITTFLSNLKESFGELKDKGGTFLKENVLDNLKKFFEWISSKLSAIDAARVMIYGLAGSLIYLVTGIGSVAFQAGKFAKASTALTKNLAELTGTFNEILQNKFLQKKSTFQKVAEGILLIAVSFGLIIGALYLLSDLNEKGQLQDALIALGLIAAGMVATIAIVGLLNKFLFKEDDLKNVAMVMIAIGASVLLLALAMKQMDKIDDLQTTIISTIALLMALTLSMMAIGLMGKEATKGASTLLALGVSLLLIVKVIEKLDALKLKNPVQTFILLVTSIVGMCAMLNASRGITAKAFGTLVGIAVSLMLMSLAIKMIAKIDMEKVSENLNAFITVFGMFAVLMVTSRLAGEHAAKAGMAIILMSVSLLIIVQAMKQIAKMDPDSISKALATVSKIMIMLGALMISTAFAGEHAIKAGIAIAILTGCLLLLTIAIYILGKMDLKQLAKGVGAVAILEGIFAGLLVATKFAEKAKAGIIAISIMLVVLTAILLALTKNIDSVKLLSATTALSEIVLALGGAMRLMSDVKAPSATAMLGMLLFVTTISVVLAMLAQMPNTDKMIPVATGVGIAVLAVASAMAIISKFGARGFNMNAFKSIEAMVLVFLEIAVILGAVIWAIDTIGIDFSLGKVMSIILSITTMLGVLIGSMILISKFAPSGFTNVAGVLASLEVMALVFVEVGAVLVALVGIAQYLDIDTSLNKVMPMVLAISTIMVVLSAAMVAICSTGATMGMVNPGGVLLGFNVLLLIFAEIAVVLGAVGAIIDTYPNVEEYLRKGVTVFELVGEALGAIVGGIIEGIGNAVLNLLPNFGTALSEFMNNLDDFIKGVSEVPDGFALKAASLAAGITALGIAELITMITSFNGDGFAKLGTSLGDFMENSKPFFDGLDDIDESKVKACEALSTMMLSLTASTLLDQISKLLGGGDNQLAKLGDELAEFGPGVAAFAEATKGIDGTKLESVGNAGIALAKFIGALPRENGWVQKVIGEHQDLTSLAEGLKAFAPDFVEFVNLISPLNEEDIKKAVTAGEAVAGFADKIPNSGGLLAKVVGDNDIGQFGMKLREFATHFVAFSNVSKGLDKDAVDKAVMCGTAVAELADLIPNQHDENSVLGWLIGDNTMGTFGANLRELATAFASSNYLMKSVDEEMFGKLKRIGESMIELSNLAPNKNGFFWETDGNLETFAKQLKTFASGIYDMSKILESVNMETIEKATNSMIYLLNALQGLGTTETVGMQEFPKFLKEIGNTGLKGFTESFTSAKDELRKTGEETAQHVIDGADSKNSSFQAEATKEVNAYIKFIQDKYDAAYNTGLGLAKSVLDGLKAIEKSTVNFSTAGTTAANQYIKGITDSSKNAKMAGSSLSENALSGINESKAMAFAAGQQVTESYISGVEHSKGLGLDVSEAVKSMASALSLIDDSAINDDVTPVLRPVIDMSDVASGMSRINTFMGEARAMSVSTDFNLNRNYTYEQSAKQMKTLETMNAKYFGELVDAINNQKPTPVNVNLRADADTKRLFKFVRDENNRMINSTGFNPLNPGISKGY